MGKRVILVPGCATGSSSLYIVNDYLATGINIISMRWMKWTGVAAALLLIVSCFTTWVDIASKNIVVTGVESSGTNFGKPGYLHLLLTVLFIAFSFIPKIWAKRSNLLATALNMAWATRNYFVITACMGGECPEKHAGIYLVPLASLLMLVAALLPDVQDEKLSGRR